MPNEIDEPVRTFLPVDRRWLFGIAGVIWSAVGVLLLSYAVQWLAPVGLSLEIVLLLAGVVVSGVFSHSVFLRIVRSNIARIDAGPERASVFAFQGWKSYLVTTFMIGLGVTLRHSALPKPWLAVMYSGIGAALLASSVLYHLRFFARAAR